MTVFNGVGKLEVATRRKSRRRRDSGAVKSHRDDQLEGPDHAWRYGKMARASGTTC